jgi:hypothetical protein
MSNILSLDLGNEFGWAIKKSATIDSGSDWLSKKGTTDHGRKFYNWACWLNDMHDIESVYYEKVMRHVSVHSAHAYGGYLAILQMWTHKRNIECSGVGVGQIKKFWTGNGRATKEMMIAEANKRGFDTDNDNCADALALLHYVVAKI